MRRLPGWVFSFALVSLSTAWGQSTPAFNTFVPGGRQLVLLDFAALPSGLPAGVRLLDGQLDIVTKDGQRMLRATARSSFLISLPEVLPQDFTLEFDIVPKMCCNPEDLAFEGTSVINQSDGSANVLWHREHQRIVGGGVHYDRPMPSALSATLPGSLTNVAVSVRGQSFTMFTNGQQVYSLAMTFARSRVLRVFLGGQNATDQAVYLSRVRIAAGAPVSVANVPAGTATNSGPLSGGVARTAGQTAATQGPTSPSNPLNNVGGSSSGSTTSSSGGNVPIGPTNFKGTDIDLHLLLQWTAVPNAVSYNIYRKEATSPAAGTLLPYRVDFPNGVSGVFSGAGTIDPHLAPNVDMLYVVEAVFADGTTSPPSTTLKLRTPGGLPTGSILTRALKSVIGPAQNLPELGGAFGCLVTWTWDPVSRHFGFGVAIDIVPNAGLGATHRIRDFLVTPPISPQTVNVATTATSWTVAVPANSTVHFCYSRWRLDHPATAIPDITLLFQGVSATTSTYSTQGLACERKIVP